MVYVSAHESADGVATCECDTTYTYDTETDTCEFDVSKCPVEPEVTYGRESLECVTE